MPKDQLCTSFANRVGTFITALSHGKIALNKYMASAIKNGVDVWNPEACLVVHIGLNTTDLMIIAKGQVLSVRSMSIACETFLEDIIDYMAHMHNARVDEPIAKQIWSAVGAAVSELEDAPVPFDVIAPNRVTALPMCIPVSYQEMAYCLHRDIDRIVFFVDRFLETVPASLVEPLSRRGIILTGEGTALRGLVQRFKEAFCIPCVAVKTLSPTPSFRSYNPSSKHTFSYQNEK